MVTGDNFAGRLYEILVRAKKVPDSHTVAGMWTTALGFEKDQVIKVYGALAALHDQLEAVQRDLSLTEPRHERYTRHFDGLRTLLSYDQSALAVSVRGFMDEGVLTTLEFLADKLSDRRQENIPDAAMLQELAESLENLERQLDVQFVPLPLRLVLSDLVESMRRAVREYHVRGGVGLHDELFYIIAMLRRNWSVVEQHPSPVMSKAWEAVHRFEALASACNNTIGIANSIQQFLPYSPMAG